MLHSLLEVSGDVSVRQCGVVVVTVVLKQHVLRQIEGPYIHQPSFVGENCWKGGREDGGREGGGRERGGEGGRAEEGGEE